jgi:hypothetical protein
MARSTTLLSEVLADVASAVTATQRGLDRDADKAPRHSSLAPLAFVLRETQLTLLGQLSVPLGSASAGSGLIFSQVGRVQTALYGSGGIARTSRISVSIQALKPEHAS